MGFVCPGGHPAVSHPNIFGSPIRMAECTRFLFVFWLSGDPCWSLGDVAAFAHFVPGLILSLDWNRRFLRDSILLYLVVRASMNTCRALNVIFIALNSGFSKLLPVERSSFTEIHSKGKYLCAVES